MSAETVFDPAFKSCEPGSLVFMRMVENLVREGVRSLDFGAGPAAYKERFGDRHYLECDLWLFGKTPKALMAGSLLKAFGAVDSLGRRAVTHIGRESAVRKWWRERLRSRSEDG